LLFSTPYEEHCDAKSFENDQPVIEIEVQDSKQKHRVSNNHSRQNNLKNDSAYHKSEGRLQTFKKENRFFSQISEYQGDTVPDDPPAGQLIKMDNFVKSSDRNTFKHKGRKTMNNNCFGSSDNIQRNESNFNRHNSLHQVDKD
jgi:hypothetical protein